MNYNNWVTTYNTVSFVNNESTNMN